MFSSLRGASLRLIRAYSTKPSALGADAAISALSKPTWSVYSLLPQPTGRKSDTEITPESLRHLLRLAALPPPSSPEEEAQLIKTLQDQLHFVRHTQAVNTAGVTPLQMIRDEVEHKEYTIEDVEADIKKSETIGKQGELEWDVLGLTQRKVGSYFVVNEAPEVPSDIAVESLTESTNEEIVRKLEEDKRAEQEAVDDVHRKLEGLEK